uniref:thiol:disulfide interchange protein DsbG n=1 Tax=Shigella boydii TaxID=621 RepID=UPI003CEAFCD2
DGNGSHASTLKSPSYTKSVSWQHYPLLVGVIKPESPATAAAILASKDPAKTWQQYEASGGKLKLNVPANVSTEQMKVLSDNEKLMDDLGANVTPAIYYMSKENTLQQAVGLPDQKTLNIIMGNK